MIRFKSADLGYTVASRAFRTEAGRGVSHLDAQRARVQSEYKLICDRHAGDRKFLSGVHRAYEEFLTNLYNPREARADRPAPEQPDLKSRSYRTPHFSRLQTKAGYVSVPPPPTRWDLSASSQKAAPDGELEMPYWRAQLAAQERGIQNVAATADGIEALGPREDGLQDYAPSNDKAEIKA